MATYAFSDVHGHLRPLERLLERVSPSSEDSIYMLGDMIDRGPEPLAVVRLCRDLPGATVLLGNHEDLMLRALDNPEDIYAVSSWEFNGGFVTHEQLDALEAAERDELVDWLRALPAAAVATVAGRPYIMAHAGLNRSKYQGVLDQVHARGGHWRADDVVALIETQTPEDLLWIREEFWGTSTGLLDEHGVGPVVIAGHTPTPYLDTVALAPDRPGMNDDQLGQVVRVGASEVTGGVAESWNIDCGAASGSAYGRICMVRLDDGAEFYEPIAEGE